MTIQMHGREIADQMRASIQAKVSAWKQQEVVPKVVTILVEGDPASSYYAKSKAKAAHKLGVDYEIIHFKHDVATAVLVQQIHRLNQDASVHGIMVELPLPLHINSSRVTQTISGYKDIDGLTKSNRFANITGEKGIYPATPLAAVRLLNHHGFSVAGKHVALVGCGETVGQPLFHLLLRENATVTACHIGTPDLSRHTLAADIIFVAVGKAGLITPEMVHTNHVIVDAGITDTGGGIVGDVDVDVVHKVRALSPTPGGVGTVTTMQLFDNLLSAIEWQAEEGLIKETAADLA